MSDNTMSAIHAALGGLALRQKAIADNISNIQTPGYKAKRIDFESSLKSAIENGTPRAAQSSIRISNDESRLDGNNVSLDTETLDLSKANLEYQAMIEAMNAKFKIIRTSIGGAF